MWKVYQKTVRRFKVTVDSIWTGEIDFEWCNEYNLNAVIQKFYDKYKDKPNHEIHVLESLNFDWEE